MIVVPILVAETSGNQRVQALLQLAQREFEATKRRRDEDQELAEITIPREYISDELIEDLRSSASSLGYDSFEKAVVSLQSIRAGKPRSISAGWTFVESLLGYLELEFIDGWLYRRSELGFLQAIRLDSINRDHYGGYSLHGRAADIKSGSFHLTMGLGRTRGLPSTILNDLNLLRETPELKAEYLAQVAHFIEVAGNDPGHQAVADGLWSFGLADYEVSNILASGRMQDANRNRKAFERVSSRRVVVESELNGELRGVLERQIAGEVIAPRVGVDDAELEALPLSPLVEVFDQAAHVYRRCILHPGSAISTGGHERGL